MRIPRVEFFFENPTRFQRARRIFFLHFGEGALSGFSKLRFSKPCATTKKGTGSYLLGYPLSACLFGEKRLRQQSLAGGSGPRPPENFIPAGTACHANKKGRNLPTQINPPG